MKNLFLIHIISFLVLGSLSAQNVFTAKVKSFQKVQNPDTLKILSVMVEFQEDKDAATYGDGKFGTIYTKDYGSEIIDPLPHDVDYFSNHLLFVKNYFEKVSRGKQNIYYDIFPDVITVPERMRFYSPENDGSDILPLANLSKDAWQLAKQNYPEFNFNNYDVFIIFHAGVGRDLTLPGSFSNERDIPSLYLSDKALRENLNDISSLPLNRSGKVNTVLIPETESREISNFGSTSLLELSINGILVANIASHLGLPDLFDTETGLSAIGRFGLMDGQAIFAYNGVFPPEPSAWEKIYLGWADYIESDLTSGEINLTASQFSNNISDTVIYKIPINSTEYYLVENRNRDVFDNGSEITFISNGNVLKEIFERDTTGFYSYSIDSLKGVIIDVDEFDWALPGSGILIWHIDENIINQKLEENKINADIDNRGVDLEEADGIQDIGERFFTIFGEEIIGEGEQFDMWYGSNSSKLFENIFDENSQPNSNSNSGAKSLVTLKDFSNPAPIMRFNLSYENELINIVKTAANTAADSIIDLKRISSDLMFTTLNNGTAYLMNPDFTILDTLPEFSNYSPAIYNNTNSFIAAGTYQNFLNIASISDSGVTLNKVDVTENTSSFPVITTEMNKYKILFGTENGNLYSFENDQLNKIFDYDDDFRVTKISAGGNNYSAILNNETKGILIQNGNVIDLDIFDKFIDVASYLKDDKYYTVVLTDYNYLRVFENGYSIGEILPFSDNLVNSFSISDFENSGNVSVLFNYDNTLTVKNSNGAMAENYPFVVSDNGELLPYYATVDFDNDSKFELFQFSSNGNIYLIDDGKIVEGFPISTGQSLIAAPILFIENEKLNILAVTDSYFYQWEINKNPGIIEWSVKNGDNQNTSFINIHSELKVSENLLENDKVYNWPNPVYENLTYIRFRTSEDSKITITIVDLAGDIVDVINLNSQGGIDRDYAWEVSQIQSGVYFANVTAESNSGRSETKVIKIAVVK